MITLRDIAAAVKGDLIGDGDIPIHDIAGIQPMFNLLNQQSCLPCKTG